MTCLWTGDIDTVKKYRYLIKRTAVDRNIRLNTKTTALTDIHACG